MLYEAIASTHEHEHELTIAFLIKDIKTTLAKKGTLEDWMMVDILCQHIADFGPVGNHEGYTFSDGSTLIETVSPMDLDAPPETIHIPNGEDEVESYELFDQQALLAMEAQLVMKDLEDNMKAYL